MNKAALPRGRAALPQYAPAQKGPRAAAVRAGFAGGFRSRIAHHFEFHACGPFLVDSRHGRHGCARHPLHGHLHQHNDLRHYRPAQRERHRPIHRGRRHPAGYPDRLRHDRQGYPYQRGGLRSACAAYAGGEGLQSGQLGDQLPKHRGAVEPSAAAGTATAAASSSTAAPSGPAPPWATPSGTAPAIPVLGTPTRPPSSQSTAAPLPLTAIP